MTVGITTPVETAAGFAFGAKRAIVANALGKIGGALTAFFLGRFIFYDTVRRELKENEFLQLVEESVTENPLLVALMVRLSPLPEPIKNLGMSVLSIKSRYFALSVLLHGFPFTCLWSFMGAETAKVVTLGAAPSSTLKVMVSASTWFGVLLSPTLIGWWVKSLRDKRAKRQAGEGKNSS
ncbi:SNARE associated Golgi protein [Seminavis robusta]|uniref:SNARE associated Golgi protein n=1 Tax=Seminavis robusta TaxID=568900 RepID=A0A9N8D847_9STRA|nr:SNARE associated Golgi protein [Seminavis robusta]|eukprot:Sro36_g022650.1 SNARE associated Golgi protein (180) ;mRNA; r:6065-6687